MSREFEIPESMRAFVETSMNQTRKAFDDMMTATWTSVGDMESSGAAMREGARSVTRETMSFAEAQIAASFELAQKLVRARDPQEMLHIQQDFIRQQVTTLQDQGRRLGEIAADLQKAGKPRG